jgi:hypothetical protein
LKVQSWMQFQSLLMMQIELVGLACSGTYVLGYLAGLLCCADYSRDVQLQGIYAVFIRGIVKKRL